MWAGVQPGPAQVLGTEQQDHVTGHMTPHPFHLPQCAEAHFPIWVQVWVEPHHPPTCGHQLHPRGLIWVVRREAQEEVEEPSFIGCFKWTTDEDVQLLSGLREKRTDAHTHTPHTCMYACTGTCAHTPLLYHLHRVAHKCHAGAHRTSL